MRVTYLKLENVAGIMVGSNKSVIEISFENARNKIVTIVGENGKGKSVLLSSISPFSGVTSVDERSTLNYIIPKKAGYKEIHYQNNDDLYIIKHYYKPNKEDGHSVKSYFNKNGVELNENGNVSSFLDLVEIHLGLTPDMMRLIRLGSNLNSFIKLNPAKRKEYISNLIDDIDVYLKIYKNINEDIKVTKTLISTNTNNIYNCRITDILLEEENLKSLNKEIIDLEKRKDNIMKQLGKIQSLMANNDIIELRKKKNDAESSLRDFDKLEYQIKEKSLSKTNIDSLISERNNLNDKKIDTQSKINSYRISIDNELKQIEQIEVMIKKITSNNDIQSLINAIESFRNKISSTSKYIKEFSYLGSPSSDISNMIGKLSSFNQIGQMIYTLGNKPLDVYLKLKDEDKSVDDFLKKQVKNINSSLNDTNIQMLLNELFKDDIIITPACDTEYQECPYYRLSSVINNIKSSLDETYDSETLRYIQVISNNVDNILNELDRMNKINIPSGIRGEFKEEKILNRMKDKLQLFDLSDLSEYLGLLKEYEIYVDNCNRLKQYEYQLSIYKQSGIESHIKSVNDAKSRIEFYKKNISVLTEEMKSINDSITDVDEKISIISKYNDSKKYQSIIRSTLDQTNKILGPLETAEKEKMEYEFKLREITNAINISRNNYRALENRINEYNRLTKEANELSERYNDLSMILAASSSKKGIPIIYMKKYLGRIQKLSNDLLYLIYEGDLKLSRFNITADSFEVPYVKNGTKIADVKYASQSENAMITMALSFALSNKASGNYNILSLDEVDAGLDESNRSASFLKMLYRQMQLLNSEQVFVISQHISQMVNVPMDVIKLSDIGVKSKNQNIIYE
jgi:DNA repair exonuclease SbcCD ATPase subunit